MRSFGRQNGDRTRRRTSAPAVRAAVRTWAEQLESRVMLSVGGSVDTLPYLPPDLELSGINGLLSRPVAGKPLHAALVYLRSHAASFGLKSSDFASPLVTDQYTDADSGQTHIYLEQRVKGVVIANADLSITLTRDNRVIVAGGHFFPNAAAAAISLRKKITSSKLLSPDRALQSAAPTLGLQLVSAPSLVAATGRVVTPTLKAMGVSATLQAAEASTDPISATLKYVPTATGLRPAWEMVLRTPDGQHWFNTEIDGITGALLGTTDWAYHFSGSGAGGLAVAGSSIVPAAASQTATASAENLTSASESYDVYPLPQKSPEDGPRAMVANPADPTYSPLGWPDNNGLSGAGSTTTTGNNVIAYVDAADANTPSFQPDGGPSHTFDYPIDYSQSPESNLAAAVTQLFYVTNKLHDIHAHYGFTEAAGNFQQTNYTHAGQGQDPLIAQAQDGGGTNNSNMQVPPDGQSPIMQMYLWDKTSPERDGDFSNDVIVHEYGHGVSTRLTGGPDNSNSLFALQSASMGEGWSDFWALMFTQKASDTQNGGYGIGDYVLGQPNSGPGIRHYPYSFNMAVNPLTFADFGTGGNVDVHDSGEIWTSALWDMNWLLIQKYGYSPDISQGYNPNIPGQNGGNNLALQLVMNALKMQAANPSFTDARDAILAADQVLNGGKDLVQLWTAFARRGLGASASDISAGVNFLTPAFDLPQSLSAARIVSSSPSGTQTTAISSVDFVFSKSMNPASFSLSTDVNSFTGPGGIDLKSSLTAFTWLNANTTLRISFTAPAATGQYAMSIGPDILSANDNLPMDQNANGLADESIDDQYFARFGYTTQPLAVASLSPAPGSTVALPMSTLDVHFNHPVDASSINSFAVLPSRGSVTGATQIDATTVRYTLSGLNAEGPVSFVFPTGAVKDLAGNDSTAYTANYSIDIGTVPFPAPFYPESPTGALVWEHTTTGDISPAGDSDNFTLNLDAGQTLSALVSATDLTLRPSVALLDTNGQVITTATAPASGQTAILQTGSITAAGTYTLRISDAGNSIGNYSVRAILNAALETEEHGGATDDTLATAQDLGSSFISLGNGASRAAVIGQLGSGGTIVAADDFSSGMLGSQWSTYSSDPSSGEVFVANVKPGQNALLMDDSNPNSVTRTLNEAIWTVNLSDVASPTLRFGQTNFGDSLDLLPTDFIGHANGDGVSISSDGIHWHRIWDGVTTSNSGIFGEVVVNLVQAAAQGGMVLGSNFKIKFQQYDVLPIPTNGRGFNNIAVQAAVTAPDYYQIGLNAGDSTSIQISGQNARGGESVELYDSAGNLLAAAAPGASNSDLTLPDFIAPATGDYYVKISGDTAANYLLLIARNAELDIEPNAVTPQPILSNAVSNTRTVLGHLSSNQPTHRYTLYLNAGQTITLDTLTPGDGPNEPLNTLDPALQLLSPTNSVSNDNSAPDGRNAHLVYTAQIAGNYIVEVDRASSTTSGDFVLSINGASAIATPFEASIVYPRNNTVQSALPTQVDLILNTLVLFQSVQASDILIDGVPATSVFLIDGQTLGFSPGGNLADGLHTVSLAAGAFTDLYGDPVQAASASFTIDSSAPRLIASSIQEGDILDPGKLTYTATFSEPMAVNGIDASAVTLKGALSGTVLTPSSLSVDATGTILTVIFQNVPQENYTLTLSAAPSGFRDIAQNALDGEPSWPIPQSGTGNGKPGGDFFVNFQVDATTVPFGKTLVADSPAGSVVYEATGQGAINWLTDVDGFTIVLNNGQTASIDVHAVKGDWQPTITLLGPNGTPVAATVTATTKGADAVLQAAPISLPGTYTIVIGSASGFGAYTARIVANALVESESAGGPSNNSLLTAQNIDGGFTLLAGGIGATRSAVVGATDVGSNDYYSVTLAAGQGLTLGISAELGDSASLQIFDATGNLIISSGATPTNEAAAISNFLAPSNGIYYIHVSGNTGFRYTLLALRDSTFDSEPNNSLDAPQDFGSSGTALGNITTNDNDVYLVAASEGQTLTLDLSASSHPQGSNPVQVRLELYDESATLVAAANAPSGGKNASITYVIPAGSSGNYRIDVESIAGSGEYVLIASGATAAAVPDGAPQLEPASDSGVSNSDLLTNFNNSSTTTQLQFLVPNTIAGGKIDLLANGVVIGTGTGNDNTTEVATDGVTALHDGEYSIIARQTLANGSITLESTALLIVIKASRPSVPPMPVLHSSADSGESSTDNLTSITTPLLDISSPVFWRLFQDGVQISDNYARGDTFTSAALPEGIHHYTLETVDAEGNTSAMSPPLAVRIDTTAPTVKNVSAPPVTSLHTTRNDFQVTYADANGVGVKSLDSNDIVITGPLGYSQPAVFLSAIPSADGTSVTALYRAVAPSIGWTGVYNGTYSINLQPKQVRDLAGNPVPAATIGTFTVALTVEPPLAPVLAPESDTGISTTDGLTKLNNSSAANILKFIVGDTNPKGMVIIYADGIQIGSAIATDATTVVSTNGSMTLSDGLHQFTARQTGVGGITTGDSAPLAVTIKTAVLATPGGPLLDLASDSGISDTDGITNVSSPTFDVNAGPYFRMYFNGNPLPQFGQGTTYTVPGVLPDGKYVVTLTASDDAGNESRPSAPISITIDTQAPLLAPSGSLDTTFGQGGIAGFDTKEVGQIAAAALQSDGKIIALGISSSIGAPPGSQFAKLVRYNANGTIDKSFGVQGALVTTLNFNSGRDLPTAIAIQANGSALIGGNNGTQAYLGRMDPGGTPFVLPVWGANTVLNAILPLPDGRIIVAGQINGTFGMAQLTPTFALDRLDTTFGVKGLVSTPFAGAATSSVSALALTSTGQILAFGTAGTGTGATLALARYSANGILDTTFGINGQVTTRVGNSTIGKALALTPDGRIIVAGTSSGANSQVALVRYTADGAVDTTFGSAGIVNQPFTNDVTVSGMVLQPDGGIVVSGSGPDPNPLDPVGTDSIFIARFSSTGAYDPVFNDGGNLDFAMGANGSDSTFLLRQPSGNLIVGGYAIPVAGQSSYFALARVTGNGTDLQLDASSDTGVNNNDGLTKNTAPLFTVTNRADSFYRIYLDGTLVSDPFENAATYPAPIGAGAVTYTLVDAAGNESAVGGVEPVVFDTQPPLVENFQASSSITAPTLTFQVTVFYDDESAMDYSTIDGSDLMLTGPGGFSETATLVSLQVRDANRGTAVYQFAAAGGGWDGSNNGVYAVVVQPGQVGDRAGNTANRRTLVNLHVDVPSDVPLPAPTAVTATNSLVIKGVTSLDNRSGASTLTFSVGGTFVGATVEILLNGVVYSSTIATSNTTTFTTDGIVPLPDGTYSITADQLRPGSIVASAQTAVFSLTINTTPLTPILSLDTDSGLPDNFTTFNNSTPAKALKFIIGSTTPGAIVEVYANSLLLGATTSSGGKITVTTDGVTTLNIGSYAITARQKWPDGTYSGISAGLVITIPKPVPPPSAPTLGFGSDSGDSNTDGITNIRTPTVFFATGGFIYVNGKFAGGRADDGSAITLPALSDGTYLITATAVDSRRNESAPSAPLKITIDTTPPTAQLIAPDLLTVSTTYSFGITFVDAGGISAKSSFAGSAVITAPADSPGVSSTLSASVTPSADGSQSVVTYTATPNDPSWYFAYNGTYRVAVSGIRDIAGNVVTAGSIGMFNVAIPQVPSALSAAPILQSATDSGDSATDGITNFNNSTVARALQFSLSGVLNGASLSLYADGKFAGNVTYSNGHYLTDGKTTLRDGVHAITVRQTVAGIQSPDSLATSVTIDTTSPVIPAPGLEPASDSGVRNDDDITNSSVSPTVLVTAPEAGNIHLVVDGADRGSVSVSLAGVFPVTIDPGRPLSDGPHTITAWEQDVAGNISAMSPQLTITVDTKPPTAQIAVTASASGTGFDHFTLTFSEPVYGLSLSALSLTLGSGANLLSSGQTLTTSDRITWTLGNVSGITSTAGTYQLAVSGVTDAAGNAASGSASFVQVAKVVARRVFYNDSVFDGKSTAANAADDKAVDATKAALLPGQKATFANYTSYANGINGIMIDVAGLPVGSLSGADFQMLVGNSSDSSTWKSAPVPLSIIIRRGAGTGGSDRIEITWPDRAIVNTWIQVRVLANSRTGLAVPDVFYFGNAVGETGDSTADADVTVADVNGARAHLSISSVGVSNSWDFNRDGRITSADVLIARGNQGSAFQLITPPPAALAKVRRQVVATSAAAAQGVSPNLPAAVSLSVSSVTQRPI